ncbi:hypothetical protein SDC9_98247 [bioreactor metagenome]|uniref:Uncharacterized protein n=1 Tax=bioreactor metagenome TaxID=1076179 RepID=A0A645AFK1_9ZZZZ
MVFMRIRSFNAEKYLEDKFCIRRNKNAGYTPYIRKVFILGISLFIAPQILNSSHGRKVLHNCRHGVTIQPARNEKRLPLGVGNELPALNGKRFDHFAYNYRMILIAEMPAAQ